MTTDWNAWHKDYDDPTSHLSERLRTVQRFISARLDETGPGPVRVMSACAGDGRDLLGVLEKRDDARRVNAVLVEADQAIAARARGHVDQLGLPGVAVRCTDAGRSNAYAGAVPAELVLLCGIFGNVSDEDVQRTVASAPQLCSPDAVVIWTRHRAAPDLTPRIRRWFDEHDFVEEAFVA